MLFNIINKLFLLLLLGLSLNANEQKLEKVTIQLQWKHQFEFAGFYAAKEKGYYRDVGLDVEFLEFSKDTNIVENVLNKKADYGLAYSSIIAEYMNGKPLVFVANFFKQSPLVLITQKNITSLSQLRGSKIEGIANNIDNITLFRMLNKFGIESHDIQTVSPTFNINAFKDKKVDAMTVFLTNEPFLLDEIGIKYNIFDPVTYGTKYYDMNLFTTKDEVLHNSSRVQKMKDASVKGWEYALSHQEEIVELILKKYNTQNKSRKSLLFEAKQTQEIMLAEVYQIGSIDLDRVKVIADNFRQSGFVNTDKKLKLKDFIYNKKNFIDLTAKEKAFIKNHKKIVLGTEKKWKPYVIVNKDGKISGYDHDVLSEINKLTGANFTLKAGDWDQMQKMAKAGEIDGLSTGGILKERKEYLNLSDVYISMQKMIITSKKNPKKIYSVKDLEYKTIAIHKSNLIDMKIAKKFINSKIITYNTIEELIDAVSSNKVDAMFGNASVIYFANELGYVNIKNVANLNEKLDLVFGVRKEYPEAIGIINKALRYMGEHKLLSLKNKWFFSQEVYEDEFLSQSDIKYVQNLKNITICVDPNWMPIEAIVDSQHVGISKDYWELFENHFGVHVDVFQTKSWNGSLEAMKQKKCDILSLSAATPQRKESLNFTETFLDFSIVLVTNEDENMILDLGLLEDKSIAIVKGFALIEYVETNYPNIDVVEVRNIQEGLEKLEEDKVFGFVDTAVSIDYMYHHSTYSNFKINTYFDYKLELGVAVNKENIQLHTILQKFVRSITDKQKETILKKWFLTQYEQKFDYTLFWQFLIVFILIIFVALYRSHSIKELNKRLQREVKEELEKSHDKDKMIFHQSKLASMGEMIENIAHQWRQPLSQVNSAVLIIDDVLDEKGIRDEEIEKKLLEIESLTQYMSNTIDDFRNFFDQDKKKDNFILENIMDKALQVVDGRLSENSIEIVSGIKTEHSSYGLPNELQQVFLVILNNAIDILVSKKISNPKITIDIEQVDGCSVIKIKDNAGGMSTEIQEKIFEPYYTTKHKAQGTGLGLYISKIIVEDSLGGTLKVQTNATGACFIIKLKVSHE